MTGGHVFQQSLDCLARFGRMVIYGFASREHVILNPERLLPANHTIMGFFLGGFFEEKPKLIRETLAKLAGFVEGGDLKLHMGGAFPLVKAAETHRLLEGRETMGKLVILPWKEI
jgi:NADPH2:quinone reductase